MMVHRLLALFGHGKSPEAEKLEQKMSSFSRAEKRAADAEVLLLNKGWIILLLR